jgi:hypothetical protein
MLFTEILIMSLLSAFNPGGNAVEASSADLQRVVMERPADPEKAVQSEYESLKKAGTREALELFIARHPDHPLAERAREDIRRLGK